MSYNFIGNNTHSTTNTNLQISRYVNNFLNKNKQININIKDVSSKNRIYNSNYDIDDIEKINLYNNNPIHPGQDKKTNNNDIYINKDSSLDETIKFSKCSSKVEEKGELGLDEVKDIIVYFNLNNEIRSKNYLFKKNDYYDFIEKRKYKYLKFFSN